MSSLTVNETAALASNAQQSLQYFDKLVRGQARLESGIEDLQRAITRLPEALRHELKNCSSGVGGNGTLGHVETDAGRGDLVTAPSGSLLPGPTTRITSDSGLASHATRLLSLIDLEDKPGGAGGPVHNPSERGFKVQESVARASTQGSSTSGKNPATVIPHDVFQELAHAMERSAYQEVRNLLQVQGRDVVTSRGTSALFAVLERTKGVVLPLHPMAWPRITFDIVSVLVLLLDAVLVPYFIAWEVDLTGPALMYTSMVTAFWALDILLNFCTCVITGNGLETSWTGIALHYLKGGLAVDFTVLLIDCVELYGSHVSDGMQTGSLRVLKFLRVVKITRLVRVVVKIRSGVFTRLEAIVRTCLRSYGLLGYARTINFAAILLKLLFLIIWLCHAATCVWYYLERRIESKVGQSWFMVMESGALGEQPDYLHGLYWSVSAMFSGSNSTPPLNQWEAVFSVTCIIMGALFVTSITSKLAAVLIESQEAHQDLKKKLRKLNAFMDQRETIPLLAIQVRDSFLVRMASPAFLTELDIPELSLIDKRLRSRLRYSHTEQHFLHVTFFRMMSTIDEKALEELCKGATPTLATAGNEIFRVNDLIDHAILLARVSDSAHGLHYSFNRFRQEPLFAGAWVCEVALFLQWRTVGALKAEAACEMLCVSCDSFIKVVTHSPVMAAVAGSYTAQLCAMHYASTIEVADVSSGIDTDQVMANTHMLVRELVSMPLLDALRHRRSVMTSLLKGINLRKLKREIERGKSHLVLGEKDDICRVVRVAVLHLQNEEGLLCVQLANTVAGTLKPRFHLPGRKVEGNQTPEEAIQSILEEDFGHMLPMIRLEEVDIQIETEQQSQSFSLRTKYIKTVQKAYLEGVFHFPEGVNMTSRSHGHPLLRHEGSVRSMLTNHMAPLSTAPFNTVGRQHAFGIAVEGEEEKMSESESSTTRRWISGDAIIELDSKVRVYKWMDEQDFMAIRGRPKEANATLQPWIHRLSKQHVARLLQFVVMPGVASPLGSASPPRLEENEMEQDLSQVSVEAAPIPEPTSIIHV